MRSRRSAPCTTKNSAGSQNHCGTSDHSHSPARLTVTGLGPGDQNLLAPLARAAIIQAKALVGYGPYVDLVEPELLEGKVLFSSPMKKELLRVEKAVEFALEGFETVIVSSGDAGVYGMAGLVLEYLERAKLLERVELAVVPGIPAICAAAARLGAPLMHDFASVSLSNLLTPLPLIMRRVRAAAEADFVLALYNPRSKRRAAYLEDALDILRAYRTPDTPVGFVRNAYRKDESIIVSTLKDCDPQWADMLSIILIGNSTSRIIGNKILTPRGYFEKYSNTASKSA